MRLFYLDIFVCWHGYARNIHMHGIYNCVGVLLWGVLACLHASIFFGYIIVLACISLKLQDTVYIIVFVFCFAVFALVCLCYAWIHDCFIMNIFETSRYQVYIIVSLVLLWWVRRHTCALLGYIILLA